MASRNIIAIGASTGGPAVLTRLLAALPLTDAAILIVQHMPPYINESVRKGIDNATGIPVRLVRKDEPVENNIAYLAPSNYHMTITTAFNIRLVNGEKVNYVRPSIDVLMKSLVPGNGARLFGVILTGMGIDGAQGIQHIKSLGGATFAQDESSCAVYGMPKAAIETGSVDFVMEPEEIARKIAELIAGDELFRPASASDTGCMMPEQPAQI